VRYIKFENISETVESLCVAAGYELGDDVLAALEQAAQKESNPAAAKILNQLIENARTAKAESIPLCQDTGLAVIFVECGADVAIKAPAGAKQATLADAINAGVEAGFKKGFLRASVVDDPLRKNSKSDNLNSKFSILNSKLPPLAGYTPAVIHYTVVPGEKLKLTVMLKGGGCENKSQFKMFRPTADRQQLIDWIVDVVKNAGADACPPFIVGVGIGGDFELSCLMSKKALLRNLNQSNTDKFYVDFEADLLTQINSLEIGPQGLGGDTTALACLIETAPCHIASLPVAVNIECHSHRHKTAII